MRFSETMLVPLAYLPEYNSVCREGYVKPCQNNGAEFHSVHLSGFVGFLSTTDEDTMFHAQHNPRDIVLRICNVNL